MVCTLKKHNLFDFLKTITQKPDFHNLFFNTDLKFLIKTTRENIVSFKAYSLVASFAVFKSFIFPKVFSWCGVLIWAI